MKTILLMAGMIAATANAATITYSTAGSSIACNGVVGCTNISNGVSITQAGATVTLIFDPTDGTGTVTSPTNINYGDIDISDPSPTPVSLTGLIVSLDVFQTAPTVHNSQFGNGTITGVLTSTSSTASIAWTQPVTIIIGNDAYTVNSATTLFAPNSNGGVATIRGSVTDTDPANAPEPATILLMGAGLGVCGLIRRYLI